ncbi:uncharacterized protein BDR25DRAFT_348632 [Lindgomyces ingoldianus]|uniref:Uncharacterized protein n=1 Tax=Lindgomyces ingoldianus TaxID=673940 RepID=A0ACB6RHX1_9PLEO|nr:uncharacterized protein BDR25DRAFT_348632 [Lindgomyces ingoldianus]KAF2478373.1 hypothetical protein BDR25DRAFT_348632 [Lindgomyces ingoldianus]
MFFISLRCLTNPSHTRESFITVLYNGLHNGLLCYVNLARPYSLATFRQTTLPQDVLTEAFSKSPSSVVQLQHSAEQPGQGASHLLQLPGEFRNRIYDDYSSSNLSSSIRRDRAETANLELNSNTMVFECPARLMRFLSRLPSLRNRGSRLWFSQPESGSNLGAVHIAAKGLLLEVVFLRTHPQITIKHIFPTFKPVFASKEGFIFTQLFVVGNFNHFIELPGTSHVL